MLHRLPSTRGVFNSAPNFRHRDLVVRAILKQKPLISRAIESMGMARFWCIGMRGRREARQMPIHTLLGRGTLNGKRLPAPGFPGHDFLDFCREVGRAWDASGGKERKACGIPLPWSKRQLVQSAMFSLSTQKKTAMGVCIDGLLSAEAELAFTEALGGYFRREASFEDLRQLYSVFAPGPLEKVGIERGRIAVQAGEVKFLISSIPERLEAISRRIEGCGQGLVLRMSLGFNDEAFPREEL